MNNTSLKPARYVRMKSRNNAELIIPNGRLRKVLHLSITLLVIVAGVQLIFHLIVAPKLQVSVLQIEYNEMLSDAEILSLSGLSGDELFFSNEINLVETNLEAHPLVQDALVTRKFPNALKIEIKERSPEIITFTKTSTGAAVPVLIDETGFIFRIGLNADEIAFEDYIIFSGIAPELLVVGNFLPEKLIKLLTNLKNLDNDGSNLSAFISELRLELPGGYHRSAVSVDQLIGTSDVFSFDNAALESGFDIVVYTVGYRIPLRFSGYISIERFQEGLMLLDTWKTQLGDARLPVVREFDLRAGPPVAVWE